MRADLACALLLLLAGGVSLPAQADGDSVAGRKAFAACANCHQDNWGKKLGPETISQGHGNPYPIYRLEWQTMGSLHRRFRSCLSGVRAEMLPQGSPEYLDLELYLTWRSGDLPIEAPGVRR